jgi:transcriptional regulator with XRE-family HTH domain
MMTIGEQVVSRRKAKGLKQREVAAKVGIDPSHLSLIENDKRDPSLRVLNGIAKAVGARVFIVWEKA